MRFKRSEEEIIMMRNGKFTVTTCVLTAANCAVGLLLMSAVILAVLLGGAAQTTSAAFFAALPVFAVIFAVLEGAFVFACVLSAKHRNGNCTLIFAVAAHIITAALWIMLLVAVLVMSEGVTGTGLYIAYCVMALVADVLSAVCAVASSVTAAKLNVRGGGLGMGALFTAGCLILPAITVFGLSSSFIFAFVCAMLYAVDVLLCICGIKPALFEHIAFITAAGACVIMSVAEAVVMWTSGGQGAYYLPAVLLAAALIAAYCVLAFSRPGKKLLSFGSERSTDKKTKDVPGMLPEGYYYLIPRACMPEDLDERDTAETASEPAPDGSPREDAQPSGDAREE